MAPWATKPKKIEVDKPCVGCRQLTVWAIPAGEHIAATCANELCGKPRPFIDKAQFGTHWGIQVAARRAVDERFELSAFERELVFMRDRHTCAHCGESLYENDTELLEEIPNALAQLRRLTSPQLELGIAASQTTVEDDVPQTVERIRRRRVIRTIDHLVQRSITLALEKSGALSDEKDFECLARRWVVASCHGCNSRRVIPHDGPINRAYADVYVVSLLGLYQDHLLKSHAADILSGYDRFIRVLGKVRTYLTDGLVRQTA